MLRNEKNAPTPYSWQTFGEHHIDADKKTGKTPKISNEL
jgi:hypothetical protein